MAKFKNALHKLGVTLEPDSQLALKDAVQDICANPVVQAEKISFSTRELVEFIGAFHEGMMYAGMKYAESVPQEIMLYRKPVKEDGMAIEFALYRGSQDGEYDEIILPHIYVARYGMLFSEGRITRMCDHLPEGYGASARVCAFCHALEECHHRHYMKTKVDRDWGSIRTDADREHPMERAAREAIKIAIEELHLPIRRIA